MFLFAPPRRQRAHFRCDQVAADEECDDCRLKYSENVLNCKHNVGCCPAAPGTRTRDRVKHFMCKFFQTKNSWTQWLRVWIHRNWYLTRMTENCLLEDCHRSVARR